MGGNDQLSGGAGLDVFVFNTATGAGSIDTITDFVVADDTIHLENAVFTALAAGGLGAAAFHIGAAATTAAHRVIYNAATGTLHYDANGAAAGGNIQATLGAGLAMTGCRRALYPAPALAKGKPAAEHNMAQDILWLGLHKTGTTFLQKSLDLSQDRLQAAGLAWVGLDEFRRRWTRPLMEEGHDGAQPAPAERPAGLPWRLVFDENIIGLVQRGVTARGLYPQAAERALKIARHLDLQRPLLVLGLRGFAGFLPSLYCEALKSTPFQTFRQFLLWPPEAMSWLPLIRRLQAAFPDSALLLYRAEDLPGHEAALLARITGLPPGDFTLLGAPERLGHSHAAIDRLHAMAREGQVSREDVRRVTAELPRGPGQPGYAPWTTGERTLLEALYARDLAHLAALSRIPGSRLQLNTPG